MGKRDAESLREKIQTLISSLYEKMRILPKGTLTE
jgi:hypothetical protein